MVNNKLFLLEFIGRLQSCLLCFTRVKPDYRRREFDIFHLLSP
jgi:hypothetical protein